MTKKWKTLFLMILIIALFINNVFQPCSLASQTDITNYETNIKEIKEALKIYRDDTTKKLYEPISEQYSDTFSVYVMQLEYIVHTKTEEQNGVLILKDEAKEILETIEILEEITGQIGTDDKVTKQGTRTEEIISEFPMGTDTRTLITNIQERKETIENYTEEDAIVDETNPFYNEYIEKTEGSPDKGIDILDGALGMVTYPAKLVVLLWGLLAQSIMSLIASTGTPNGGIWLTIDNILFNQLALTDINIFSDSIFLIGAGGTYQQEVLSSTNPLLNIRVSIAQWYYAFRNLAIVASLLMLIYIGIRMAISNIAEQKAKYKAMLTNWFVGFGLIFVLHFIIIIVININNAIIEILAKTNLTDNQEAYSNIMNQLFAQSWSPSFTWGWASAIMWVILVIMTFILLIMFIKRFVTVSFLTLIAPLITVTYAMDKAGDNRSQILNTWLKEFCYNVFIQIVYALSYLIFAKIGIDIMVEKLDFGAITLAVLSLAAMFLAVKIIKQIFGFDKASSLVQQIAMATVVTSAFSTMKKGIGYGKDIKEKHQKENSVTKNLPMYTSSGKDTYKFLEDLKEQKRRKLIHAQIAQKSEENKYKKKRLLKNLPKAIKVPMRAFYRFEKGTLEKGLGIDKLEEAFKTNKLDKITITAQDIANDILGDYVMKTNAKMTSNEFDRRIKRVEQKKSYELTGTDALLKSWMEALKAKEGAGQVQRLVANFKDNHFKEGKKK